MTTSIRSFRDTTGEVTDGRLSVGGGRNLIHCLCLRTTLHPWLLANAMATESTTPQYTDHHYTSISATDSPISVVTTSSIWNISAETTGRSVLIITRLLGTGEGGGGREKERKY